jgi:hypothetical protein
MRVERIDSEGFRSWRHDLDAVFEVLQQIALGRCPVRTIVINDRISLGLPADKEMAKLVLDLYRPMKCRARLLARGIRAFIRIGGYLALKKHPDFNRASEISWLRECSEIGFLGCNPDHGLRCVLLSRESNQKIKVTKLAVGKNVDAILAEGNFLKSESEKYRGVPKLSGIETGEGWAAICLAHFPYSGPRDFKNGEEIELLEGWLAEEFVLLENVEWLRPFFFRLNSEFRKRFRGMGVRKALLHGDFAPWNLRKNESGLAAIDWEWARADGIGGLDLGHGMVMAARLVDELSGAQLVDVLFERVQHQPYQNYLKKCGWDDLNLWLFLGISYSKKFSGLDFEEELEVLENRMEPSLWN